MYVGLRPTFMEWPTMYWEYLKEPYVGLSTADGGADEVTARGMILVNYLVITTCVMYGH